MFSCPAYDLAYLEDDFMVTPQHHSGFTKERVKTRGFPRHPTPISWTLVLRGLLATSWLYGLPGVPPRQVGGGGCLTPVAVPVQPRAPRAAVANRWTQAGSVQSQGTQ
jgi:hypothetical protein